MYNTYHIIVNLKEISLWKPSWTIGITWNVFFQNLGTWLKTPMEIFSFFGNEYFFLILLPALYWCLEATIGLRVGLILLLSTSVNDALKMAFHGPRPYWLSPEVIRYASETSFGAPSGHAQIAIGVWGMLAASLRKWWGWLIAILIILLIGISRLYLGVHFPHDVILGLVDRGDLAVAGAAFLETGCFVGKKDEPGATDPGVLPQLRWCSSFFP